MDLFPEGSSSKSLSVLGQVRDDLVCMLRQWNQWESLQSMVYCN